MNWFTIGAHYKSTPNFKALPPTIQELLVRSIAINSGYTSRVIVSTVVKTALSVSLTHTDKLSLSQVLINCHSHMY